MENEEEKKKKREGSFLLLLVWGFGVRKEIFFLEREKMLMKKRK